MKINQNLQVNFNGAIQILNNAENRRYTNAIARSYNVNSIIANDQQNGTFNILFRDDGTSEKEAINFLSAHQIPHTHIPGYVDLVTFGKLCASKISDGCSLH